MNYNKSQARADELSAGRLNATSVRRHAESVLCPHCQAPAAWACTNKQGGLISKPHAKRTKMADAQSHDAYDCPYNCPSIAVGARCPKGYEEQE